MFKGVRYAGMDSSAGIQNFIEHCNQDKRVNQNQEQDAGKGQVIQSAWTRTGKSRLRKTEMRSETRKTTNKQRLGFDWYNNIDHILIYAYMSV